MGEAAILSENASGGLEMPSGDLEMPRGDLEMPRGDSITTLTDW
jgi:hypothetical protein